MSAGAAPAVVADSWAALAWFRREEPASTVVRRYLTRAHAGHLVLKMNLINVGELSYRLIQLRGEEEAELKLSLFRKLPIEFVQAKESLILEAAKLKARFPLSYADAFAVATARQERASLLTGDPEIIRLPKNVVRVIALTRH